MTEGSWLLTQHDEGAPSTTRYLNRMPSTDGRRGRRRDRRAAWGQYIPVDGDAVGRIAPRAGPVVEPARMVAETLRSALATPSAHRALDLIADAAMATGCWHASNLSAVEAGGALRTVSRTSPTASRLDELQISLGEGPVLDVVSADPVVQVLTTDLHQEVRWPSWSRAAAAAGFRTALTFRLFTDVTIGALSLYSRHRECFNSDTLTGAQLAAAQASVVLAYARSEWRTWTALDVQNTVVRAQGFLMGRHGIAADAALEVLRTCATQQELPLAEIARRLTETAACLDPAARTTWCSTGTPDKAATLKETT